MESLKGAIRYVKYRNGNDITRSGRLPYLGYGRDVGGEKVCCTHLRSRQMTLQYSHQLFCKKNNYNYVIDGRAGSFLV